MLRAPIGKAYLPYQEEGVAFATQHNACLIGDDMGLGKTVQAIGVINNTPDALRVLIVCPASLKLNWKRELDAWLLPPLTVGIADGKTLPDADVVIINYDVLEKHNLRAEPWDLLIVDECQYCKNWKSRRTQAVLGKGGIPAKRKLFLSGTPMENRPIELWPLLYSLAPKYWGKQHEYGMRYCAGREEVVIQSLNPADWAKLREYRAKHSEPAGAVKIMTVASWNRFVKLYQPNKRSTRVKRSWNFTGASNLAELHARLRKFMIRRRKVDVLKDLPPKVRQIIELPLSGEAKKAVKLEASEYRKAVQKLRQENVEAAFEEMSSVRRETALAKLPAVIDFLHDAVDASGKVVVFAHHRDVVMRIAEAFGEQAVFLIGGMSASAKDAAVQDFINDPHVHLFVGSISAAGVGIDGLQKVCSHVVFAELSWVPAQLTQAEDRCNRMGQEQSVLVQHLVLAESLDARMAKALTHKQDVLDQTLDGTGTPFDWTAALEED